MFVGAEMRQGVLAVRVRAARPMHRFFGIPVALDLAVDDVESVEFVRHPISRLQRARVRTTPESGADNYVFSTWVGQELLAAGAPPMPSADR